MNKDYNLPPILCCPNCRVSLTYTYTGYYCNNCKKKYLLEDGIISFTSGTDFYNGVMDRKGMLRCLALMEKNGFTVGLSKFMEEIPLNIAKDIISCVSKFKSGALEPFLPIKNKSSLLSLGADWGSIIVPFAEKFSHITVMDVAREHLLALRYRLIEENINNVTLVLNNNIHRLPFSDLQFDLVTLDGISDYADLLPEVYRTLKLNGILIFGITNKYAFDSMFGLSEENEKSQNRSISYYSAKRLIKKSGFCSHCVIIPKPDYQNMTELIPITKLSWNQCNYKNGSLIPYNHKPIQRVLRFILKTLRLQHLFVKNYLIIASKSSHSFSMFDKVISEFSRYSGNRWYINKISLSHTGYLLFTLISKKERAFGRMPLYSIAYELLLSGNKLKENLLTNERLPQSFKRLIPRTLFSYSYQGNIVCIEDYFYGSHPNPKEKDQPWFFEAIDFIQAINRIPLFNKKNDRNEILDSLVISSFPTFKSVEFHDQVMPIIDYLYNVLRDIDIPFSFAHGDFHFDNLVVNKANRLKAVIDWDNCCSQQVFGYDVMLFLKELRGSRLKRKWEDFVYSMEELDYFLTVKEKEAIKNFFDRFQVALTHKYWNVMLGIVWLVQLKLLIDELHMIDMNRYNQFIIPTVNKLNKMFNIKKFY